MTFTVHELPKAQWDKRHIVEWLVTRSPQGAAAWLAAYDQMVQRLENAADTFPPAQESADLDVVVKQALFKTRRGRAYRAVFHIDGTEVYILRVRGPGQAPIANDDVEG
jgi:hypothetical protein